MLEDALPRGLGERLLSLRSFSPLAALPATELALVARLSYERDYQVGQTLATEGEPVRAVQLLVSGRAALSRAGVLVEMAGAFDTVGLLPLAAGIPHHLTAIAVEPIQVLEIDADLVDEVLGDDFDLFTRVLRLGAASARARRGGEGGGAGTRAGAGAREAAGVLRGSRRDESPPVDADLLRELLGPLAAARTLLVLRDTPLFRTAPVDSLAAFAKRLELVSLRPGETLEMGGASGALGVVVAGRGEVTLVGGATGQGAGAATGQGVADSVGLDRAGSPGIAVSVGVQAGDVVGGLEALSVDSTLVSAPLLVRAQTELHLLRGTASDLLDIMEDHHAMGRRLLAEILGLSNA